MREDVVEDHRDPRAAAEDGRTPGSVLGRALPGDPAAVGKIEPERVDGLVQVFRILGLLVEP